MKLAESPHELICLRTTTRLYICVLKPRVLRPSLTVKAGGRCSSSSCCCLRIPPPVASTEERMGVPPLRSAPLTQPPPPPPLLTVEPQRFRTPSEPALHPPSPARNPPAVLYDRPDGKSDGTLYFLRVCVCVDAERGIGGWRPERGMLRACMDQRGGDGCWSSDRHRQPTYLDPLEG
ncbi:hypothetical protein FQA47_009140 [Oryzias melastigma]|uniref:Uncharacterized protein n=1 Tax=Oryzias melastigma TaxID=30732 RepID=A0A834FLX4_ORYME|nr:hypothetical protein FQA47_009140 [Oryzias melastigma]